MMSSLHNGLSEVLPTRLASGNTLNALQMSFPLRIHRVRLKKDRRLHKAQVHSAWTSKQFVTGRYARFETLGP